VWRGAELLDDYKDAPCTIKVQFEEAEVRGQGHCFNDQGHEVG